MTDRPARDTRAILRRDPVAAARSDYDLVVIGAGIYGVAAALSAARRGARVLLLERGDFGGETSWNSLRVLHGGLRYLQTLDLVRFRESIRARSWYVGEVPGLIEPMPCLMPFYADRPLRRSLLRPAIAINEGLRRLWSSPAEKALLPAGGILDAESVRRRFRLVRPDGLRGGALWYDGSFTRPQRIIMELLRRACADGAVALNYVEAIGIETAGRRVTGVKATDCREGTDVTFRTSAVLNCAGPWAADVTGGMDAQLEEALHPSLAFNLLLRRDLQSDAAVAVEPAGGGQTYFLRPFGRTTLAGTVHIPAADGQIAPSREQIEDFLGSLRAAAPGFDVGADDVLRVLHGTLLAARQGTADVAKREIFSNAAESGGPAGLYSLVGIKYTTAPLASERAVAKILAAAGLTTGSTAKSSACLPLRAVPSLAEVEDLAAVDEDAARTIVRSIVEEESVLTAGDLVSRRTDWGLYPDGESRALELVRNLCPELSSDGG